MSEIICVNISCSFQIIGHFNIDKLQNCIPVKGKKFKAFVFRLESPKCSFNIFNNGKVVLNGLKNLTDLHISINILLNLLSKKKDLNTLK